MKRMERNITIVMSIGLAIAVLTMLIGIFAGNEPIMNIGIFAMILTPVLRVVTSIFTFAAERDKLYVCITVAVLAILICCFVVGFCLSKIAV